MLMNYNYYNANAKSFKAIFIMIFFTLFCCYEVYSQADHYLKSAPNKALKMDGDDNDVRTGMGIIKGSWTLEAWIRGNDLFWKPMEAIFGGGEYSDLNSVDNLPLILKDGYLFNNGAKLSSTTKLDSNWHQVAISCDGKQTKLYLDGQLLSKRDTSFTILPGAIGTHEKGQTFGGWIDEVRIWTCAVPQSVIRGWRHRSIQKNHPFFKNLIGYYNFEDFRDNMSINWVGLGHQSYHLRNNRINFYGNSPMAIIEDVKIPLFSNFNGNQVVFNAVAIQNEWDLTQGDQLGQTCKLRIAVQGTNAPLSLDSLELDLSQCSSLSDIATVHLFDAGSSPRLSKKIEIFGSGIIPQKKLMLKTAKSGNKVFLRPGINYFLIALDIKDNATVHNNLRIKITSLTLAGKRYGVSQAKDEVLQQVVASKNNAPNQFKLLQWNIWHGGVHIGKEQGRARVIELIKASKADIVTMQEAYGAQDTIAGALGFYLQTKSAKENLALFSRYPIETITSSEPFKSNPGKITLPNGKKILINDCWLRYASNPEYTSSYGNYNLNPTIWTAEDSTLSLVDAKNILAKDVFPYIESADMPIIIAGDFNSCSHLDWTTRSKRLHFGYGPVAFPTSKFMNEQGFTDSFREVNPNENSYQGGTAAVIYGHMQMSRIDFVYYKGKLTAKHSKIVRSSPEIDDVWASDHAAVLSTFETVDSD